MRLPIANRERGHWIPAVLAIALGCTTNAAYPKSAEEVFAQVSPSVMIVVASTPGQDDASQGSGVVIAPQMVVTNCHVLTYQQEVAVYSPDGVGWPASLSEVDWRRDICILQVDGLKAPAVTLGRLADLRIGQKVYAIGSPQGLALTLSDGLLSGFRDFGFGAVIQMTAPISMGSSGGGLFDEQGVLLGITTSILDDSQNLNFAHPSDWIRELLYKRR